MLIKEIEYEDFLGNKRKEKFHFHLTKAEIVEFVSTDGDYGFDRLIEKIISEKNQRKMIGYMKELIYKSYGVVSEDGRRFIKNEEVKQNFMETEAYSDLFMELASSDKAAAEFINGIMPSDLAKEVEKSFKENPERIPAELKSYAEAAVGNNIIPLA